MRTQIGSALYRPASSEGRPDVTLGDLWLEGPDGRVAFGRDPGEGITKVDFDGLSSQSPP